MLSWPGELQRARRIARHALAPAPGTSHEILLLIAGFEVRLLRPRNVTNSSPTPNALSRVASLGYAGAASAIADSNSVVRSCCVHSDSAARGCMSAEAETPYHPVADVPLKRRHDITPVTALRQAPLQCRKASGNRKIASVVTARGSCLVVRESNGSMVDGSQIQLAGTGHPAGPSASGAETFEDYLLARKLISRADLEKAERLRKETGATLLRGPAQVIGAAIAGAGPRNRRFPWRSGRRGRSMAEAGFGRYRHLAGILARAQGIPP